MTPTIVTPDLSRPDQLDVQVSVATNLIRRRHNEAQQRLGLPVTPHEATVPGGGG